MKLKASELALITRIADRAVGIARDDLGVHGCTRGKFAMPLVECHLNAVALDLARLLSFNDGDLAHDVFGILRHLDRESGKLNDCFLPRCAK